MFQDYCDEIGTKICFASVAYPQSNGAVESANGQIMQGIKKRVLNHLKAYSKNWMEGLFCVLWALRTTTSRATGETPFTLVYSAEAVLPSEIQLGSTRIDLLDQINQGDLHEDDINILEERHDRELLKSAAYL